jgi:hypothetical protein
VKLKTFVCKNLFGQYRCIAIGIDPAKADHLPSLTYDASAAHALMRALGEFAGDHTNLPLCITRRADEILAEWGYGDGCG